MNNAILLAFLATCGTWAITALGSATVAFFKSPREKALNIMLGFSAGVMIAASFWSLLQPAIERAEKIGTFPPYVITAMGFLCGGLFMWASDKTISIMRRRQDSADTAQSNRIIMLILSITLHNIPEGLAVGVAFGALQNGSFSPEALMAAISVAVGIGIQNFPEGAAVSLPLRREGCSRFKSFTLGQLSGMVEPPAGLIGALLVTRTEALLPFALSFAAGAMILVAVHELIPECQKNRKNQQYTTTLGIMLGFAVMMVLDVMLG